MMKKQIFLLIATIFLLNSCQNNRFDNSKSQDHLIMSVLWYQKSAEMKALYYQGFNLAKLRLDMKTEDKSLKKPKAVVVDIDETMLNNSPFEVNCIRAGKGYTKESWKNWTSMEKATALPGAVEFSKYAESKSVEVFYISNRSVSEFNVTLVNLQKENFAFADSSHLLLKTNTSNKEERRNIVRKNFDIILLIGDNLGDFSDIFDDRTDNNGFNTVENNISKFGDLFIVLPNPIYGAWESPILNNQRNISDEEKYKLRKSNLIGY